MEAFDLSNYNWYVREDILQALSPIQTEYSHQYSTYVYIRETTSLEPLIQSHVITRINSWTHSFSEDTIWIQGSWNGLRTPISRNTLEAIYAKVASDNALMPNVFYFYSLRLSTLNHQPEPSKGEMLLDMVKCIILQLVVFLPDEVYTDMDLSTERFLQLTDPTVGISTALSLLRDIRVFAPHYLNCIVEGLEKVDSTTDERQRQNLRRTLLELSKHRPELASNVRAGDYTVAKIVRACFASTGNIGPLSDMVNTGRAERVVETSYPLTTEYYILPDPYGLP